MAEICLERGITICSDEIHCDLVFSGEKHTPIASLDPEIAQKTRFAVLLIIPIQSCASAI
jgi:cystathionine beta-lyase